MEFEKRKSGTLDLIKSPEPDKSPKGDIDIPIIPLLNTINSHPSYFTTSSCSGRISILSQPLTTTTTKKKAKGGTWLFISHDPVDPTSILPLLFPSTRSEPTTDSPPHDFVFRFEPLIIAVECKDVEAAQSLVSLAISSGFRESGITSVSKRVIIAIRCSIRLEAPLGDTRKLMVSPEYVMYLVQVANEKMEANRKRTNSFLEALLKNGFSSPEKNVCNGKQVLVTGDLDCEGVSLSDETKMFESLNNSASIDAKRRDFDDSRCGSTVQIEISGEPIERLFVWGHSASTGEGENKKKVFIFGGFGGIGRHSRRNDLLVLDPESGKLENINLQNAPSPRLGHTCSIVGNFMYVIGGRADPVNILDDVWALDNTKYEWTLLHASGTMFPPRHRHASAVVGPVVYVFGGIHNDEISSSLYALDTHSFVWSEINTHGDKPCARHSHSMVTYESHLYIFGGHNGEKALDDLYSFDVQTCIWKKEKTLGQIPHPRFSHMMFVYKNYIGILGGCPVSQNHQDISLLDLKSRTWEHVKLECVTKDLFVRSTCNVVCDDLIIVGGGASCYAFGTRFSGPVKVNLLSLLKPIVRENGNVKPCISTVHQVFVLCLERKYAKLGKDLLKKFGWLDLGRKVWSKEGGEYICFPVTNKFCDLYSETQRDLDEIAVNCGEVLLSKDITESTALKFLGACGASKVRDEVVKVKKAPVSPLTMMKEAITPLLSKQGLSLELLEQLPSRWERLGDMIVLPATSFKDPAWDPVSKELWPIIATLLGTQRLARQGRIASNGTRDSGLEMLVGDNGWVEHCENGIKYSFDATKCMFSWGNLSEKLRMGSLSCTDEVIVDLFAGIGYFTLPFLVRGNAKMVYACEWNPFAVEALRRNLIANHVADRCVLLEGDNRQTAPKGVADRVCLGLIPTSEGSWATAVRALREEGGMLHIHGNVKDTEESEWAESVSKSILEISRSQGHSWEICVEHIERVKWYAPHIRHLVADVKCKRV